MRILHVTASHAGGVSRALETIASEYEAEHHLLWAGSEQPTLGIPYTSTLEMPESHFGRIQTFFDTVRKVKPDVVHAHSSWAGFYSRVLPSKAPIIYEPHCFVFDDPQRSTLARAAYRLAESILSWNTKLTVVLSSHEQRLARGLRPRNPTRFLPNVASLENDGSKPPLSSNRVVMIGRIVPQKDPQFFADVARLVKSRGFAAEFVWIGDGDDIELRRRLEDHNVRITGWLDKQSLGQSLLDSSIYLHSASYEGFPLSVLDAAALGLPVVVRDLSCFEETGLETIRTAPEAADKVIELLSSASEREKSVALSHEVTKTMNIDAHLSALTGIYREAVL